MPIPAQYLFHLVNKTKKQFTPDAIPTSNDVQVRPSCGVLCFSTSNFEAMKAFFAALGFVVTEGHDQLLPLFHDGRGARVKRGNFEFNLEEDTSKNHAAAFNMMLTDLSADEINRAKNSGHHFTHEQSIYGDFYTFKSPDGGTFVIG